jgi:TRAP-type mannitol/chloroaromatic compound transport system permease small subunit
MAVFYEYIEAYSIMCIEKGINSLGKFISLMIPVMTILMIVIIVARYFFGIGLTGLQEFVMYLHAFIFLGCAGYVHYKDEHVRVDIFYRDSSNSYKNNVNFILSLFFLLPVCFVIGFYSLELIEMSWKIREVSTEAGGLGYVYIQKTLIILFPLTMILTFAYQLIHKKWK